MRYGFMIIYIGSQRGVDSLDEFYVLRSIYTILEKFQNTFFDYNLNPLELTHIQFINFLAIISLHVK